MSDKRTQIEAIAPGTPVTFGDEHPNGQPKHRGHVIAVQFSADGLQYRVAYWSGDDRKAAWLNEFEFTAVGEHPERVQIGFR